ncbi:toll-like receptor 4 [Physella acuta]|uniref:toll-like receptor 4 n=1 Tax=Physella acuta TaxID=109671 RepID=UPI0027DE3BB1|nr:toll-like receptor 4 [Physella acuta]
MSFFSSLCAAVVCFLLVSPGRCSYGHNLLNALATSRLSDLYEEHCKDICNDTSFLSHIKYLNCSFKDLTCVPALAQEYSTVVIEFDLHNNSISYIENETFSGYFNLEKLDLSNNLISLLQAYAFIGLGSLTHLNLFNNQLPMTSSTFHDDVFNPLVNLTWLKLNRNNNVSLEGLNYPDVALSKLVKLEYLFLDGVRNADFGPGFQNLTSLRSLTLAGYDEGNCHMGSLSNTTFQYLQPLTYLNIRSCFITGKFIAAGAFLPLKNLVTLNITHNEDIDIHGLRNVFYGLRNTTSLRELSMNLIVNRYSLGICLDSSYLKYFPPNLEILHAQENNLEAVERNLTSLLPKTLKYLDVSGNRFVFGTYLKDLPLLENLEELQFNHATFEYLIPGSYPFEISLKASDSNCTLYGKYKTDAKNEQFMFYLPPKLKRLEMNSVDLHYKLTEFRVADNILQYLSVTGNSFRQLIGPIHNLRKLTVLNISSSSVEIISDVFFTTLTSLKSLNLSSNRLGSFFKTQNTNDVFAPLVNLKMLDLSNNAISVLPQNLFSKLLSLEILHLEQNPLNVFNVNLTDLEKLNYISLKSTKLLNIATGIRTHIDYLIDNNKQFTIILEGAPISCTCDNYHFLLWMTSSKAFNSKFRGYVCVYGDNSQKPIDDGYNTTVRNLNGECTDHVTLFLSVGGGSLVTFSLIIYALLYRYRWRIRYLYYAAYLQYKKSGKQKQNDFEFDAFISYDHKDHNFVVNKLYPELKKRGLNVFIHGRDFVAGDYIASNIVKAVCTCRKTVVVLTRNMINSYWCGYEIQMANIESIHTGRPVLIFLLMEKIPETDLGRELLYNIRNNTYIPYPDPLPDATSIGRLWDKLASDIRN